MYFSLSPGTGGDTVNTDSHETAGRPHEVQVSEAAIALKERHSEELALLTEVEKRQLAIWNATQQEYPQDVCVPHLVATQAAITPDAVALVAAGQALNYRELNRRANQL